MFSKSVEVGWTHGCGPGYPQSEPIIVFPPRQIFVVFIPPVAIKAQREPEIVWAVRRTAAAAQQIHRIVVIAG
jgi:hypothetical protein